MKKQNKTKGCGIQGEEREKKTKKTGWWRCHKDQTPTSVAYNGRESLEASEDD